MNFNKACGGGKGKKPLTVLWLYNKLSECTIMQQLNTKANQFLAQMHESDRRYLIKIPNKKQYAVACCAMSADICMYGRSASSGVEAMNRANKLVHEKTAINILNAAILLLKLEGEQYHIWKAKVWKRALPFTPRGMDIMQEVFENVQARSYMLGIEEDMTSYIVSVSKNLLLVRGSSW